MITETAAVLRGVEALAFGHRVVDRRHHQRPLGPRGGRRHAAVIRQLETLAVQLDHWHSRVAVSDRRFKVDIQGVTQGWRSWLDARSTNPRLSSADHDGGG